MPEQIIARSTASARSFLQRRIFSLTNQLRYGTVLLVTMSLLSVGTLLIGISLENHTQTLSQLQRERSKGAAANITAYLNDMQQRPASIANIHGLTDLPLDIQQTLLEGLTRNNAVYEAVAILDSTGKVAATVAPYSRTVLQNHADAPWFIEAFTRKRAVISDVEIDPVTLTPMVNLAFPAYNQQEVVSGVLLARINLEYLWLVVNNTDIGETGYTYIIDAQGQVIAEKGQRPETFELYTAPNLDVLQSVQSGVVAEGNIYQGLRGQEVLGALAPIATTDWSVVVELPTMEAFAPVVQMLTAMGIALGGTIVVVSGISFFFARQISIPLQRLTRAAQEIGAGHMDTQVEINTSNEMGLLAATFNDMASRIRAAQAHLEAQVAERTAQLAAALRDAEIARANAEEANNLKTRFLANMSHELRTPLNSIINFAYILKSGVRGPVTEEQIEYLNRVYASGEHLLGMINDILDLSKIEAGRMELFKEAVELGDLVVSTMASAIGLTKDKPITLHHEIADNLPAIEADKTRIRQVLLNLLSNAAKFTDVGSITVRVWQQKNEIITSVTDTGIGIPTDKLDAIFEEFRQADEGSARSYEGTGLGLPICQRLVEMHGGRIWVESQVGAGSTFCFSLPLAAVPALEALETVVSLPLAGTEQGAVVLVIDDDPTAIEVVRTYLEQDGYAVYGVTDGRAALEAVRRLCPAAILLDIIMPFANGWNILAELKTAPDLYAIPVIMYTVDDAERKGLSLGADGYLVKPVEAQQLRDMVAHFAPPRGMVLAIDDDPNMLEIVQQHLGGTGDYHVVTASGGQAGLDAIAAQRPDLVLLDLMMPEVDGFAVLEQLDQQPATRTIPVVILSARELTPDEHSYLRSRVNGLVSKQDSQPEQWINQVRAALTQRMRVAPAGDRQ